MTTAREQRSCPETWLALDAHRAAMTRLARARGCNADDADDVVSDALLRAATYEELDISRARQFLAVVIGNLIIDQARRQEAQRRLLPRLYESHHESHEVAVCDRAAGAAAATHLLRLPPTERQVLLARAAGRSVACVAKDLCLSEKAVEGAYTRARQRMRRFLTPLAVLVGWATLPRPRWRETTAWAAAPVLVAAAVAVWGEPAPEAAGSQPDRSTAAAPLERAVYVLELDHPETTLGRTGAARLPGPWPTVVERRIAEPNVSVTPGVPTVVVLPPRVERYDQDETLLESLTRCLREGPQISAAEIGCPPRSQSGKAPDTGAGLASGELA